ncbi:RNA pseudouridine synthase [Stutzerimonas degradans]|uniref:Dual-specificity RNA pseudouridine synthase RluF n=1 Tax=Stutzerimonas degradans TaxID=2968968 RepID=A0A8E2QAS9_9GAMM|nr:RNA pseudouridine synthase [Stutzerimonas degradans]MCQ4277115.1 RNA pseudouridine synthase [Stutzerimonas degradans]PNF75264.1 RNA-binding protein [Stutzerimonas degradans]QPT22178.1 RNA-binding protein [Stutzerimonas degradans]
MTDPVRLSKRLADQLGCSRREAELYIEGGWVTVDDQVVQAPFFKVQPAQRLTLLPGATANEIAPVTLLLHKPAGASVPTDAAAALQLLSAVGHWAEDPSTTAPLQRHLLRQNVLLPLEDEASGLLVFSQQREVIRLLSDARSKLEQEFIVEVSGEPEADGLALLGNGIGHRGRILPKAKASWQNETHLRVAVKQPQPGELRMLCEAIGLRVLGYKRIRIGRLSMAKLPLGQWRFLGEHERF